MPTMPTTMMMDDDPPAPPGGGAGKGKGGGVDGGVEKVDPVGGYGYGGFRTGRRDAASSAVAVAASPLHIEGGCGCAGGCVEEEEGAAPPFGAGSKGRRHSHSSDGGGGGGGDGGGERRHPAGPEGGGNPGNPGNTGGNKLSAAGLAVLIFYNVSGGPFGLEETVRSAGNFYSLLGFLVFPFVWSLQEALITAELGSSFPEASGGVAWVEEAFGMRAGFMSGYLGWVAGATDNAIYPVLFLDYLLEATGWHDYGDDGDGDDSAAAAAWTRWALLSGTAIALAFVNYRGLPVVEAMSMGICAVAMSPFLILVVVGAFKVDPRRWLEMPQQDLSYSDDVDVDVIANATATTMDDSGGGGRFLQAAASAGAGGGGGGLLIRPYLNNLFWNLNSFDSAASYSGDIRGDPGKVLPRALMAALVMTFLGYFLPLLVALGASDADQSDWVDGYLAKVAEDVVGPWLGAWTVLAAGISNIALFQAELSSDAFQLMGMADRGHLPKIFSTRSRHGTPTYGIALGTLVIVGMSVTDLDDLIEMLNFNYALALLMEYCAFLKLRMSRPDLRRPFRIPLNTFGCIVLLAPTLVFTFAIIGLASFKTYLFSVGANLVGLLLFAAMRRQRQQQGPIGGSSCCRPRWLPFCRRKMYSPVETVSAAATTAPPSAVSGQGDSTFNSSSVDASAGAAAATATRPEII